MQIVDLEFPWKAAITDTGRLVILRTINIYGRSPVTEVSLSPEASQKLLDLLCNGAVEHTLAVDDGQAVVNQGRDSLPVTTKA